MTRGGAPRLSMVVAMYNVAPYLDAFCESLVDQQGGVDDLEVILVDDGSTDVTGDIARGWVARHRHLFRLLEQPNAGVAAARNAGLAAARGDWVSFPDPDDFLAPGYLAAMRAEIARPQWRPLLAVAAPLVFYHEATETYTDDHPLRGRFGRRVRRVGSTDMGPVLLPHTSATFMRRADITALGLRFDGRIRPSFEDAHLIIRLILHRPHRTVSFLPRTAPAYFYRKRAAGGSLVDGVTTDRNWYGPHLQNAYLSLLDEAQALRGRIPRFVQASVLFSLLAKLRHLTGPDFDPELLSAAEVTEFKDGLQTLMDRIDTATLRDRRIPGLHAWQRAALLCHYKGMRPSRPWVVLADGNRDGAGTARIILRWILPGDLPDTVQVLQDGQAVATGRATETRMLFDVVYARVITQEVNLAPGQGLRVVLNGKPLPLFAEMRDPILGNRRFLGWRVSGTRWLRLARK